MDNNAELIAEARNTQNYGHEDLADLANLLADALEAAEAELTRRQAVIDEARTANHFSPIKNYRVEEILAAAPVYLEAPQTIPGAACGQRWSEELGVPFFCNLPMRHEEPHAIPGGQAAAPSLETVKAEAWDEGNEACRAVYVEGRKSGPVVNPYRKPEEAHRA